MNNEEAKNEEHEVAEESKLIFTSDEFSYWITEVFEGQKDHIIWCRNTQDILVEVNELKVTRIIEDPSDSQWFKYVRNGHALSGSGDIELGDTKAVVSLLGSEKGVSTVAVSIVEALENSSGFNDGWNNYSVLVGGRFAGGFFIETHLESELFHELVKCVRAKEIANLSMVIKAADVRGLFSNRDNYNVVGRTLEFINHLKYLGDQKVEGLERGSELEKKVRAGVGDTLEGYFEKMRTSISWVYKSKFESESRISLEERKDKKQEICEEKVKREDEEMEMEIEEERKKLKPHIEMMNVMRSISIALWFILISIITSYFF